MAIQWILPLTIESAFRGGEFINEIGGLQWILPSGTIVNGQPLPGSVWILPLTIESAFRGGEFINASGDILQYILPSGTVVNDQAAVAGVGGVIIPVFVHHYRMQRA